MNTSLIDKVRRRIKDVRPNQRAMGLSISDDLVARASVEIKDGHLVVEVMGSNETSSIDWDLTRREYATVGDLYRQLSRLDGYHVERDEDMNEGHASLDLDELGPLDIAVNKSVAPLKHHVFSNLELEEILEDATKRHNPSMDLASLPEEEHPFVLTLAHAEVCRRQAYDSSKRKGLSESVSDLLSIAGDLESTYEKDVRRLARAITSPKEAASNLIGTGDVVQGKLFRQSLRTGRISPVSQNPGPTQAVLLEPDPVRDCEDTNIRLRWQRNRDMNFHTAELWVDSVPEVQRSGVYGRYPDFAARSPQLTGAMRPTTSKRVFLAYGSNSNIDSATYRTFVEEFGQEVTSYVVEGFEPETTYYARMFIIDNNREISESNVVQYNTLPLRTRFKRVPFTSSLRAVPGAIVRVYFDEKFAPVTANHIIRMNEAECPLIIEGPYVATFVVPNFNNKRDKKDLVIVSPTKLFDIRESVFVVL